MSKLEAVTTASALKMWPVDDGEERCETPGRPFLVGWNASKKVALLTRPDCGMWSCPYCAQQNALKWTARAIKGAGALMACGEKLNFLTLTHRGGISPARARQRWRDCWPKLSARMRRASPDKIKYLYVHEQHKSGVMHTHMILSGCWDERWWKDNPARTGFGYMNDISDVEDYLQAGSYVAKYLAKQLNLLKWPPGWRRLGTSRDWPKLPEARKTIGWDWLVSMSAIDARAEIEGLHLKGYRIEVQADEGLAALIASAFDGDF